MKKLKLFGMKSHDCHVFMQRLIPIAFQELLPTNVWEALTELSLFFHGLNINWFIGNKAQVEGSICNSYETIEGSKFFHYYFPKLANSSSTQPVTNNSEEHPNILSIFAQHGETIGKGNKRYLSDEEITAAHTYILLNCIEVEPFIEIYRTYQRYCQPHLSVAQIDATLDAEFSKWFNRFVQEPMNNVTNIFLKALAMDPYQDDEPESHPIQIVANDEHELLIDDSATQLNIVDVEIEVDSCKDENENEYFDLIEDD
ncbi:hypothetical protein HRI_004581800 [Hibiscus trionum]|uniref:DUF4218 domain-containing protein n=1 Tax=Hibiscus trionum TaxID=183268 RepID=A0A9W7J5S4_HIBTR|nr:hypothetical protein HRI_004581800 [Hibiscus trionum]